MYCSILVSTVFGAAFISFVFIQILQLKLKCEWCAWLRKQGQEGVGVSESGDDGGRRGVCVCVRA